MAAHAVPGQLGGGARRLALRPHDAGLHQRRRQQDHRRHQLPAHRARPPAVGRRPRERDARRRPRSSPRTPRSPATCRPRCASSPARSPTASARSSSRRSPCSSGSGSTAASATRWTGPPGNGTDDLVTFLGTGDDGRVGYCEQFAADHGADGPVARHPLAGRRRLPASGPGRPEHLRLQLARPARLARDVLRRHRLGAVRADTSGTCHRRPGVHHRARAAAGPQPEQLGADSSAHPEPHRPLGRPGGGRRRWRLGCVVVRPRHHRHRAGAAGPRAAGSAAADPADAGASPAVEPRPTAWSGWSRRPGRRSGTPRSTSASPSTTT